MMLMKLRAKCAPKQWNSLPNSAGHSAPPYLEKGLCGGKRALTLPRHMLQEIDKVWDLFFFSKMLF